MSGSHKVRVAVVGMGWWGTTIAASLSDSKWIEVALGVEPDDARRVEVGDRLGIAMASSYEAALSSPDVDAVVLCTPHPMHADQVISAARAGKHVFCEKPFTVTSAEARAALGAVAEAGVQVGIGHERRFEPAVQELQQRVRDGELGVPLIFEGNFSQDKFLDLPPDNWRLSNELAPVGPLSATGIHLVDLAISILGRPVSVWARLATLATAFANGDTLSVTLGFESGATATISASLTTPFVGRVCVMGSTGWAEIRDRAHPENPQGWDVASCVRGGEVATRHHPPFPSVRENLERFAESVRGGEPYPVSPEQIALNVATFEAIVRSAASGNLERI
ncbi:Gfo/Idh/MocA family oxidoreductase [Aeromicrobium sp. CFBP 8757]|uniref:Gfo/Idh/MocA family protein n=1 Tax=Aeromicrobium sp. CFBP 8757 TaxID=2775288 RepID=UPI0017867C24|nr:Gfo/Idh/MocA family oxidoreductase [Aeromicrobium sp. CFBP 8757]MBD8605539.1 Gfo/Idh/MocA family oxidoreductase [Aeromicrobium sp. CFBP 8757]